MKLDAEYAAAGNGGDEALAGLRQVNLAGVIGGKALYEGRFTIAEAQTALAGSGRAQEASDAL